jgi:hypothetical protein
MFYKASLIIFTLALFTMAGPVKKTTSRIRIPLFRHTTLTNPDGTINMKKAISHGIAINKYVTAASRIVYDG